MSGIEVCTLGCNSPAGCPENCVRFGVDSQSARFVPGDVIAMGFSGESAVVSR